nr:hypothetical protein [Candidatus Njordarchaeum guaymaensis]
MRRSLPFAFTILSVLALLSASLTSSLAADYTKIGVKVGDTADYLFASSDRKMDGAVAHVSVQKVEGTKVTINGTIRYPNGTMQAQYISDDVSSGQNSSYYFLICANLTQGDPVYSGSQMNITETISMSVAGALRDVNHFSSENILTSFNIYWDRLSGLMVSLGGSGFGYSITATLTNTTVWSPSSQRPSGTNNTGSTGSASNDSGGVTLWLVAGGTAAVVMIAAVVVLRRRRK